jgi:hypothetical protein
MRGVTPFEVRNGRIVSGRLYMEEVEEAGEDIDETYAASRKESVGRRVTRSPDLPLGRRARSVSTARRRAFIEEVRGDDPELAASLRIEGRELEASAVN